jgi:hypothetical protein
MRTEYIIKLLKKIWNFIRVKIFNSTEVIPVGESVILPILSSPGKYVFYCPGCEDNHTIDTNPSKFKSTHTLTGTLANPTIRASVLETGDANIAGYRCHSFVTNGKIKFLNDCTHHLAGKTVDMPPL